MFGSAGEYIKVTDVTKYVSTQIYTYVRAYYMEASYLAKRIEKRIRSKACAH